MGSTPTTQEQNCARSARERLLDAALKVFAQHGYDDASTREITDAAGTNVASVNYYFGSKEQLYTELVRARASQCQRMRMDAIKGAQAEGLGIKATFHAFISVHLQRSMGADGPDTDMALFFHEFTNQGPGFEIIMEEMIHPAHKVLTALLMESYPGMTLDKATLCLASLMAQVVHFIQNRPVMKSINPSGTNTPSADALCDHIVDITFNGIESLTATTGENEGVTT